MPEDDKFDFQDLKLPDDFSASLKPPTEEAPAEPLPEQAEAQAKTEEAPVEEDAKAEKKAKKEKKRKKEKAEPAESVTGEGKPSTVWSRVGPIMEKLSAADLFTVMLSIALVALLIAILCCLIELGRYRFDIRAKGAKQAITATTKVDANYRLFC
ncbi:MAG TPA: hypothetical protein VIH42_07815 [Thermoguttaceae bacterium]